MINLTFEEWLRRVDNIVGEKYGLDVNDGVDWPSRDSYEAGDTPTEGSRKWRAAQE